MHGTGQSLMSGVVFMMIIIMMTIMMMILIDELNDDDGLASSAPFNFRSISALFPRLLLASTPFLNISQLSTTIFRFFSGTVESHNNSNNCCNTNINVSVTNS